MEKRKRVKAHECYMSDFFSFDDVCVGRRTLRKMYGEKNKVWVCKQHWDFLGTEFYCEGGRLVCPACPAPKKDECWRLEKKYVHELV